MKKAWNIGQAVALVVWALEGVNLNGLLLGIILHLLGVAK